MKNVATDRSTNHGRQRSTGGNSVYVAIAGEVVNTKSVHLINFGGGGQIIALKSATALILDRWKSLKKTDSKTELNK